MLKENSNSKNIKGFKFLQIDEYILLFIIKMIFFIDTVSPAPKILLINNNIISSVEIPINNDIQISESLIMKLLETFKSDFDIKTANKIVVCRGPGSFTALRIGIVAAVGFKSALNIPLYGITAFDILLRYSRVNYNYENVHVVIGSSNNQNFYAALNIKDEFIIKPKKIKNLNDLNKSTDSSMLISNIKISDNYYNHFSFIFSVDICQAVSSYNLSKLIKEQDTLHPFYI